MANTLTFANQTISDANLFGEVSYLIDLNSEEEFSIGNTASASVSFVTDIQVPLYSKDHTNGVFTWTNDNVSRGRFYITDVTKAEGKYTVTAYDAMSLLDVSITSLPMIYPANMAWIASTIAAYIGCTVSGTIYNSTLAITKVDDIGAFTTARQVLSWIAEASGASVMIDGSDQLCFVYYPDSNITVPSSEYETLESADYTCAAINKVQIYNYVGDVIASSGTGTNILFIKSNPFLVGAADTHAATILGQLSGLAYTPLTCNMFEMNGVEVGTKATFGSISTLVMHLASSEQGVTVSSTGTDSRAGYTRSIADDAEEARETALSAQSVASIAAAAAEAAQTAADNAAEDAEQAALAAEQAKDSADIARASAETAAELANSASQSATSALVSAGAAGVYADSALAQLAFVEDIFGVLSLLQKNGTYTLSTDSAPQGKWYFTRSGTAPEYSYAVVQSPVESYAYILTADIAIDPGKTYYTYNSTDDVYEVVEDPDVADIGTYYEYTNSPALHGWYELTGIDESIQDYVTSQLALSDEGLWLQTAGSDSQILLSSEDGVQIWKSGVMVAQYGESAQIGSAAGFHIKIDGQELGFYQTENSKVAYIRNNQLFINQSVVVQSLDVGLRKDQIDPATSLPGKGQWSWRVHENANGENNLCLKWLG